MFTKSAAFYDAIYAAARKDYAREARQIRSVIRQYTTSSGNRLLDVACGTGAHLAALRPYFRVEGLDLDPRMLEIARRRCPSVRFHRANMTAFNLRRTFDAVVCLFSSIGYVRTIPRLRRTLRTLTRHTAPGGVVIVEPWIFPRRFKAGHLGAVLVDRPDFKIARLGTSVRRGGVSTVRFHYLVGRHGQIEHFTEDHTLGLFPHRAYVHAFEAAGLRVRFDTKGLMGRGLYIGSRPAR